jgi:predicted 3-demethylubiquinone-9 3-methyltransferase (glyoxalase superfamily)
MQTGLIPNLWFDKNAKEAAEFYVSVFPDSKIEKVRLYPDAGQEVTGGTPGEVLSVDFTVNGQPMIGINGGPLFKPNEAVSLMVLCDTQEEVDEYWEKMTADGGEESMCGWLKDKYGFSWQITPKGIDDYVAADGSEGAKRAMECMLKMKKLDIAEIKKAYDGS